MTRPLMQPTAPGPAIARTDIVEGFSIEMTAKDVEALRVAAPLIPPGTCVAITFLPSEDAEARIAATRVVRSLGFVPMPHFSARRLASAEDFERFLGRLVAESGVRRCFIVAGDAAEPAGPFADTATLIATGAFERAGVRTVGLAGHPEGHPHMTPEQCLDVLADKCASVRQRGMKPIIVTQFGFDADPFLHWIETLRARGIDAPVRIGVPGPAGIKTLMRFAARCGVGASASVLARYGISIGKLIGTAGPDRMLAALSAGLGPQHGEVHLHFYPFGGLEKTVAWIADFRART